MKKAILLIVVFILLGFLSTNAQPIITLNGISPVIGDKYVEGKIYSSTINQSLLDSGENKTWDFSMLKDSVVLQTNYLSTNNTPFVDSFANATIANYESTEQFYNYFTINSSSYSFLGNYDVVKSKLITYSPAYTYLQLPMSYNKSFVQAVKYIDKTSPYSLSFSDTVIADSYGTLILPSGTFKDVLRVKIKSTAYLDFGQGIRQIGNFYSYSFYENDIHQPVLSLTINDVNNNWQGVYYKATALPLDVINFSANWQNGTPRLKWEVGTIASIKGYFVQRRKDGSSVFEDIGWVNATEINKLNRFEFVDKASSSNKHYYRLKQVDKSGECLNSNVISLVPNKRIYSYNAFPNPSHSEIQISMPFGEMEDVSIYDMKGKLVFENKSLIANEKIKTKEWPSGNYFIIIKNSTGIFSNQFVHY